MKKAVAAALLAGCLLGPTAVLAAGIPTSGCALLEFLGFTFVK
jgi:Kef-type K+ transport system membrane component KefB